MSQDLVGNIETIPGMSMDFILGTSSAVGGRDGRLKGW